MKVKIFVPYHQEWRKIKNKIFTPIHVGKAISDINLEMIGDDTGDNISDRNPYYCELTGQYWVWKNDCNHDYIGFMHYSRFLILEKSYSSEIDVEMHPFDVEDFFNNYEKTLSGLIEKFDIICPMKHRIPDKNIIDHFHRSDFLNDNALYSAIEIFNRKYPEYKKIAKEYLHSNFLIPCNMYILKKNIYIEYMEFIFDILFEVEKKLDLSILNAEESRILGHVAERLFPIFLQIQIKEKPSLRVYYAARTHKNEILKNDTAYPLYPGNDNTVVVCLTFNGKNTSKAIVVISSILAKSSIENNYDIVILGRVMGEKYKKAITSIVNLKPNFSVRFIDIMEYMYKYDIATEHLSADIYSRLFIPFIFSNYNKVIYIDNDAIINQDLIELMNVDPGNEMIAGAKSVINHGNIRLNVLTTFLDRDGKRTEAIPYIQNYIGLNKQMHDYIEAGVIIWNIKNIDLSWYRNEIETVIEKKWWNHGQDIINYIFKGNINFLELKWNYIPSYKDYNWAKLLPRDVYMEYLTAQRNPGIIHFAGDEKPWDNYEIEYGYLFWKYSRLTPFYSKLFNNLVNKRGTVN